MGRSKPVDALDAACKQLHDGYECAEIDSEANGELCTSWDLNYPAISFSTLTERISHIDGMCIQSVRKGICREIFGSVF